MKFAFLRRAVTEQEVFVDAETETEAWAKALDNNTFYEFGDLRETRKPTFNRLPKLDEFDL